jgi:hypothetical protein
MLEALEILVDAGLRDGSETLRSVGSPLIEIGFPIAYPPRLGPDELIIITDRIDTATAELLVESIPEIKGVILRGGVPGIDSISPSAGELLTGCDLRGDVVQSMLGELVIYKNQSMVHIEFPRERAPKIRAIEDLYFRGLIRDVVDGLSGPGTLGLMCALGGAERVVLNDIWLPALEDVILNLFVNRGLLGIEEIWRPEKSEGPIGSDPVMVGRATGRCEIEVYHSDLLKLFDRVEPGELCLIDPFPGTEIKHLVEACKRCRETVVI